MPPQAAVERQALGGSPVVLEEGGKVISGYMGVNAATLSKSGDVAEHEIGQIVSGQGASELELAALQILTGDGRVHSQQLSPEGELVLAFHVGRDFPESLVTAIVGADLGPNKVKVTVHENAELRRR